MPYGACPTNAFPRALFNWMRGAAFPILTIEHGRGRSNLELRSKMGKPLSIGWTIASAACPWNNVADPRRAICAITACSVAPEFWHGLATLVMMRVPAAVSVGRRLSGRRKPVHGNVLLRHCQPVRARLGPVATGSAGRS